MQNVEMVFSVSELNQYVNALMSADPHLRNLKVSGEISGFKRHSSGHLYFSLKDEGGIVSCVMFKSNAMQLKFCPQDGKKVLIEGTASIYTKGGTFQVYVNSMEETGSGELYRRFLELKQKLEDNGIFDSAHKKEIPFLPKTVGVITSGTGAAIQDILNILGRRFPKMNITFCPVRVQGEGAANEVAKAIALMNQKKICDVLIVGRGGGSLEDLWAFNEEIVAMAIYNSDIPIISAVGHETDYTISDFVADLRAPTPSAAAELAVPEYCDLESTLQSCGKRLEGILQKNLERRKDKLMLLKNSPTLIQFQFRFMDTRKTLDSLNEKLYRGLSDNITVKRQKLDVLKEKLTVLSPDCVLNRGFALITDARGNLVDSVDKTEVGEKVNIRLSDGEAFAIINSKSYRS